MPENVIPIRKPTPPGAVYLTTEPVRDRFGGVSRPWIARRQREDGFPTHVNFGRSKAFRLAEIEAWESAQAAKPAREYPNNLRRGSKS